MATFIINAHDILFCLKYYLGCYILTYSSFSMKKSLLFFGLLCFLSVPAYTQKTPDDHPQNHQQDSRHLSPKEKEQKWQEKYNSASPEKQQKMQQKKAMLQNLSPQQKKDLKDI